MAISVAVKPVNTTAIWGSVTNASTPTYTYGTVTASGSLTSTGVPVYFGSSGYTAYVYVKAGGGGAADIDLQYAPLIHKDQTGELYGASESIAAAGTFASDGIWYPVDFTPHATEKIRFKVGNADVGTATEIVVIFKHGGA